jgi:hypothetical protein
MYFDLIRFPIRHEALKWEAREAFLDIDGVPHLFIRIKLTGTAFPATAQIAQVWVGSVFAAKVIVDQDLRAVRAYFDKRLPRRRNLYFGHLGRAELDFGRFAPRRVVRLGVSRRKLKQFKLSRQQNPGRARPPPTEVIR